MKKLEHTSTEKWHRWYLRIVGEGSFFASLRLSFMLLLPVFLVGACALMLQSFPVAAIREWILTAGNGTVYEFLQLIYHATYEFAAVYLVIAMAYVESRAQTDLTDVRALAVISATACYFAFMGPDVHSGRVSLVEYTKMANVFSAFLIAFLSTRFFFLVYRLLCRGRSDHVATFVRVVRSVVPMVCCLAVAATVAELISLIPDVHNFNDLVVLILSKPFESIGATYFGGLLIMLLESVLWLFGIHGGNVLDSLLTSQTGAFAFSGGQIMSKPFVDTFVLMGGCGTTSCLLIALLLFSGDRQKKKLCRLAAPSLLFNINELLVYGLPVVLNPVYAVPFILTPLLSYSLAYAAVAVGLVPPIINAGVTWTTPVLVSGYQATGSVAGSLLQLVLLVCGVAMYMPFVWLDNRLTVKNEAVYLQYLTDTCRACERAGKSYRLERDNMAYHAFEEDIAARIDSDIAAGKIYLQYQPQVKNGKIISAEALLRFGWGESGFLYPPLVVGIATNNGLFEALSRVIVSRALRDLTEAQRQDPAFHMAVNLRLELLMQDSFRSWLIGEVEKSGVVPYTFGVEITEDAEMSDSDRLGEAFDQLKRAQMEVLMDDFSMGHTSISILQKNYFDYIKIDGNLIRQLAENERCRSIVASIVHLGDQLHFSVIAEYVESEVQQRMLEEMGCYIYQGYLYYRDMPMEQLIRLLSRQGEKEDSPAVSEGN